MELSRSLLSGWVDAYIGFNELYRNGRIMRAHARRNIRNVHVRIPSSLMRKALKRIGELYAIEAEIRGISARTRAENETAAEIPGKRVA
ncbi:conserved hypothetical protein [Klebsiella grimontii]|uniref:Transposase IS66 central domain-containing protein n=1 Tax=Klebsiella grimontii TaxID=2058152 RepID=A0A285B9N1_9ENTR|nr:conserved hypothetical protein [Klebsiella grimontii]